MSTACAEQASPAAGSIHKQLISEDLHHDIADRFAVKADRVAESARNERSKHFNIEMPDVPPTHGIRDVKDAMSRFLVPELRGAEISIASATCGIVGLPPSEIKRTACN